MNSLILERKKPKGGSDIKQLTIRAVPGFLIFWHFPTKVTKKPIQFQFATSDCRISVEWRLGWLASWKLAG